MSSRLEALDHIIDMTVTEGVGDTIVYHVAGEPRPRTLLGFVDFGDDLTRAGQAGAIAQAIVCEVNISDLPALPDADDRISFPRRAGNFQPHNAEIGDSGTTYVFRVKTVRT